MWRHLASIGLILVLGGAAARGDTISLSVTGLPATYTPGSPLTFEVGLAGAADLNSYDVGLDLTSNKGTAGADFYFAGSPSTYRPPDSANSYVFGSNLGVSSPFGFVATPGTFPGTNTATLNLSDFIASGQSVSDSGSNTMLATVVIGTTPEAGDLTLSFDGSLLELLAPNGQTVAGSINFSNPPAVVVQSPEPSTLALLTTGAIGWLSYGLRRRRAASRTARPAAIDQPDEAPAILAFPSHSSPAAAARRAA